MTFSTPFSDSGLPIGSNDSNLTYLYGLSDFFTVMFEDTSKLNLMLEAEAYVASEIYSRFLQYSSSLSLEGISETIDGSIKLVLLSDSDLVAGSVNTYKLPSNVTSTRLIANRAFLPTELLDNEVDYRITQEADGSCYVAFAKSLNRYSFPVRVLPNTNASQYALWFVDAKIDEYMISKFYGNLIGLTPENSTQKFADLVYGLFYVYMHGPRLDTLSRGLNLVLGIPIARAAETVLSIRTYLDTDQFLVICDQNQYIIPYGLEPTCREGDVLVVGDPLASWVEIKDYEHDGEWWINLFIPEKLIKQIPEGQKDRYATAGSHFDYLMRTYLKTHTFLVKVNVTNFKNIQLYSQISDIVSKVKPSYTETIYIWALAQEDTMPMSDNMAFNYHADWDDSIGPCISRLRRDNQNDAIPRGQRSFIRFNASNKVAAIVGVDDYVSNQTDYFGQDIINGYVNPLNNLRPDSPTEQGWVRAVLNRGNIALDRQRNKIGFHRNAASPDSLHGTPTYYEHAVWKPDLATKMIPLYTISVHKLTEKMEAAGYPAPDESDWWFELFSLRNYGQAINDLAINYLPPDYDPNALANNYNLFMSRGEDNPYFGREFNERSYQSWAPEPHQISTGDHLLCIRITPTVIGVYWITTSTNLNNPTAFFCDTLDPLVITYDMPLSRSGGGNGCPFYAMRGRGRIITTSGHAEINENAINTEPINGLNEAAITEIGDAPLTLNYSDKYNPTMVIDRSGIILKHAVELK